MPSISEGEVYVSKDGKKMEKAWSLFSGFPISAGFTLKSSLSSDFVVGKLQGASVVTQIRLDLYIRRATSAAPQPWTARSSERSLRATREKP